MWDARYLGCGMFKIWYVWYVGCSRCGIFKIKDVRDVRFLGCGMFAMWDVETV